MSYGSRLGLEVQLWGFLDAFFLGCRNRGSSVILVGGSSRGQGG